MLEEQVKDVEVKSDERVSEEQKKYKEILVIIKLVDIAEIVNLQRHTYFRKYFFIISKLFCTFVHAADIYMLIIIVQPDLYYKLHH